VWDHHQGSSLTSWVLIEKIQIQTQRRVNSTIESESDQGRFYRTMGRDVVNSVVTFNQSRWQGKWGGVGGGGWWGGEVGVLGD
jgi:hypothetical protein